MRWVFLIFLVIPVLEMIVLIEVGSILGSFTTVFLVFFTALLGVAMLRHQGLNTLLSFNQKLNSGDLPAEELLSAVFLVLAGAFLLTPGFVTDSLGFLLLLPPFRSMLAQYLIQQGLLKATQGFEQSQFHNFFGQDGFNQNQPQGSVYEHERREEPDDAHPQAHIPDAAVCTPEEGSNIEEKNKSS